MSELNLTDFEFTGEYRQLEPGDWYEFCGEPRQTLEPTESCWAVIRPKETDTE